MSDFILNKVRKYTNFWFPQLFRASIIIEHLLHTSTRDLRIVFDHTVYDQTRKFKKINKLGLVCTKL